jgi:hypothetical protein
LRISLRAIEAKANVGKLNSSTSPRNLPSEEKKETITDLM